jgi:DNA-binding IclR family transcriptional regulator
MPERASAYSHVVPSADEADKQIIKSAHRVMQIFEFFASVRQPSSATEISQALNFPQSSASMLLRSLVTMGYLEYHNEDRTYEPTIRLSLLGGWVPQRIDIANHIIDTLNGLHEQFDETIVLAQRYRNFVRYIYSIQHPEQGISYYVRPGTLRPAITSATGLALLTLATERDVISVINRTNAEEPDPEQWIKRGDLLARLAEAREAGYAYHERMLDEFMGIQVAVLLPPEEGAPRLAVGMVTRASRYEPRKEEIVGRLLEISRGG